MRAPTPLRRELLVSFATLFAVAVSLAIVGLLVLFSGFTTFVGATLFITTLVGLDLLVVFLFGSRILENRLVAPVQRLVSDVRTIAEGDHTHRVGSMGSLELESIRQSVNVMADRLVLEGQRLAANVESLERTNEELVEARDQVVQTARLASVGSLAAGIAHEVGNPLGAILGYVDVARRRAERTGADTDLLDAMRTEVSRIDRIVRGLLDYARPRDQEVGPVPPSAVLERVRGLLESQGRLESVVHEWRCDPSVPDVVLEPQRLEQVLVNLLLNALDALEDQEGAPRILVTLDAEPGEIRRMPRRREDDPPGIDYAHRRRVARVDPLFTARTVVVIRVADNGPGLSGEVRGRVFDPFFTTKAPGKGTGLGLSICARLVEGMGGRITAEVPGIDGEGATFTIRLPAAPSGDSTEDPADTGAAPGGRGEEQDGPETPGLHDRGAGSAGRDSTTNAPGGRA